MSAKPQLVPDRRPPDSCSLLAYLLHALNQPLTGLQCSLELAAVVPRSAEQHLSTLRDALVLTARMRILVGALRELADASPSQPGPASSLFLDGLLLATADELRPVAEAKRVHLRVVFSVPLLVKADRPCLAGILFRLLESLVTLSESGTELQIAALPERGAACLIFSWTSAARPPEHSPFSPAELGLLLAQDAWQHLGGACDHTTADHSQTCALRMPLLPSTETEA